MLVKDSDVLFSFAYKEVSRQVVVPKAEHASHSFA